MSYKNHLARYIVCFLAALLLCVIAPGQVHEAAAAGNKPSAPVVTGKASGVTVTLSWPKVANATGYQIYKLENGAYVRYKNIWSGNAYTGKFKEKYNGQYSYKIRSMRKVNGKYYYSSFTKVTVKTATSVKAVVTGTNRDKTKSAQVTWKTTKYADGYEVYRSETKNGPFKCVKVIKDGKTGSCRVADLTKGKSYYVKVRAFRQNTGSRVYGGFGAIGTIPVNAAPTPTPTPTPTPVITPLPEQPSLTRTMLIVGDSLTANMKGYLDMSSLASVSASYKSNSASLKWISYAGAKYSWLEATAGAITASLDGRTDVYIWMGVNDAWDGTIYQKYVNLFKNYVPQWKALGARVFIISVGPLGDPITENDKYYTNKEIEAFNKKIQSAITGGTIPGAVFVDLYSYIKKLGPVYLENDRYHFDANTSIKIFYYLLSIAEGK